MAESKERSGKFTLLGFLAGIVTVLLVLAGAGLFVVYSGSYNIAATEEHFPLVRWAFHKTLHTSVENRAAKVDEPVEITPEMISAGAAAYKRECQHCHAGPGAERSAWSKGMRPEPPRLAEEGGHWSTGEIFWLAKHGIKMSGMPAFGPTHDDQTLWNIAAFVKRLPNMTPDDYAATSANDERAPRTSANGGTQPPESQIQ